MLTEVLACIMDAEKAQKHGEPGCVIAPSPLATSLPLLVRRASRYSDQATASASASADLSPLGSGIGILKVHAAYRKALSTNTTEPSPPTTTTSIQADARLSGRSFTAISALSYG